MATTTVYSAALSLKALARAAFSGDSTGGRTIEETLNLTFAAAGGSDPTISGFLKGTVTVAAGDLLLAHATDPFQAMGDAGYSDGFTVAGSKIKLLIIRNSDATRSITVARAAANGLPIFDTAGDSVTIPPGGVFLFYLPTGTAALTTGSNDALTLTPSAGNPTAEVTVFYGP